MRTAVLVVAVGLALSGATASAGPARPGCLDGDDPQDRAYAGQAASAPVVSPALDLLSVRLAEAAVGRGWLLTIRVADLVRPLPGQQHYHRMRFSLDDRLVAATIVVTPLSEPPNTYASDSFTVGPAAGADAPLLPHYVTGEVDPAADRLTLSFSPADVGLTSFVGHPLTGLVVHSELVTGRTVGLVADTAHFRRAQAVAGRYLC